MRKIVTIGGHIPTPVDKLHLGVDETTRETLAADVTERSVHDSRRLPTLLSRMADTIAQVSGDRGYDTRAAYEAVLACGAVATIVPRRNARMSEGIDPPTWRMARDATLRAIEAKGRYGWRTSSGCTGKVWLRMRFSDSKPHSEGSFGRGPLRIKGSRRPSNVQRSTK